jgi:alkanesulfonate monooxygenase SsuD/methylene tetrahydromethanopterin reductase-like flavin-dependent oxidoreductase (luciferase family)
VIQLKISISIEPHAGYTYNDIVTLASAAEDAGFYRFTVSDHFFGWIEGTENECYEAWTTLALLTPQTEKIRLSTQVTSQSFRNPALLAKIVANLDNASDGRIDLGIGAGWKKAEYDAYGYEFPSTKTRILQLREALEIINLLWAENRPSFDGEFYRIKEAMFLPKPVQTPRIPIWIGTETLEAPMMEETIARYADGVDYAKRGGGTFVDYAQKKERIQDMCEKVGRNFDDLIWSSGLNVAVIGEDEDDFENRKREVIGQDWPHKVFTEEFKKKALDAGCKQDLAGSPEMVLERLLQYKDHVDVFNIGLPFVGNIRQWGLETIRILKDHIIPKL